MKLDLILSVQGKDIPTLVAVSSGQVSHNEKENLRDFFYFWHKERRINREIRPQKHNDRRNSSKEVDII